MIDKIELLEELLNVSKEFDFTYDGVLKIKEYYKGNKRINVNFIALIEIMCEKLNHNDINRILLTDEELENL